MQAETQTPLLPAKEIEIPLKAFNKKKSVPYSRITEFQSPLFEKMVSPAASFTVNAGTNEISGVAWQNEEKVTLCQRNGAVTTWNLSTNETQEEYRMNYATEAIAWDPSGKQLLVSDRGGNLVVIDSSSRETKHYKSPSAVERVDWHPDGKKFVAAAWYQVLVFQHDLESPDIVFNHQSTCYSVQWDKSGSRIASGGTGRDKSVRIWDVEQNKELKKMMGHQADIYYVRWDPDSKRICSLGKEKYLKIWLAETGELLQNIDSNIYELWCCDWSSDGKFISVVGKDMVLTVFDATDTMEICKKPAHTATPSFVRWSPNNSHIATCGNDGKVKIFNWSVNNVENLEVYDLGSRAYSVGWNDEPSRLAVGLNNGVIKVWEWEVNPPNIVELKLNHVDVVWFLSWYENGDKLLTNTNYEIQLWDYNTKQIVWKVSDDVYIYNSKATANLSHIACGGRKVRIWRRKDTEGFSYELIREITLGVVIYGLNWNKAETHLLVGGVDGCVRAFEKPEKDETEEWKEVIHFKEHIGEVWTTMWSEDSYFIVSSGTDGVIRVFNAELKTQVMKMIGHIGTIYSMTWMEKGRNVLSSSEVDGALWIWDFETGVPLRSIVLGSAYRFASGNSEGTIAFTGGLDNKLRIYKYMDIWGNFNQYKCLYFTFEFLPKIDEMLPLYEPFLRDFVDVVILENLSVFHLLIEKKMGKGLKLILDFCDAHQIYPKKFYDSEKNPLLKGLLDCDNSDISVAVKDSFIEYAINANVPLGMFFIVTEQDLVKLMSINSFRVCKLIENRFKKLDVKYFNVNWLNQEIVRSTSTVKNVSNLRGLDFVSAEKLKSHGFPCVGFEALSSSTTEMTYISEMDIPISALSGEFLDSVTGSAAFDEFCKSNPMISFLDLMWLRHVKNYFFYCNIVPFLFFVTFIINSLFILPNYLLDQDGGEDRGYWIPFLVISLISGTILTKIMINEILQYRSEPSEYFASVWNYIDVANIFLGLICFFMNILTIFEVFEYHEVVRLVNSFCFFLSMIRIFDFFRAFRSTCFLIELILQVLIDMKAFFLLMILFLVNFSCSVFILQSGYDKGIVESFLAFYYLMLGNTGSFDEYDTAFAPTTLIIVYIITTLICVIVMLNLLISIIGNTFGSVSEINELIYEKNRLIMIRDFLQEKKEAIEPIAKEYLMTIYREDPEMMEMSEIEKRMYNMERSLNKKFERLESELHRSRKY